MWLKSVLLQVLILYIFHEPHVVSQKNACRIYQVCEILPKSGKQASKHQIERIKQRVESTKEKVLSIQLKNAVRAEQEKSKWRKRADNYCESPQQKINKILECEDLQMTHENMNYFAELKKYCGKLLEVAESGADNEKLIATVDECERKAHSRDVFKRFESLRSNLQQRCQWEEKRRVAIKHARYYEEQSRKLRAEANKFGNLIENSLRIENDETVRVDLTQEQIEQLVKILKQTNRESQDVQEIQEIEDIEEQEEESESVEVEPEVPVQSNDDELNDLVEIISRQIKSKKERVKSSPDVTAKRCKKRSKTAGQESCGEKLSVELSKNDISRLLKFLDNQEPESVDVSDNEPQHEPLRKLIAEELKVKTNSEESSEEIVQTCGRSPLKVVSRKQTTPKAVSNCGQKLNLDFTEENVLKLVKLLKSQEETRRKKVKTAPAAAKLQNRGASRVEPTPSELAIPKFPQFISPAGGSIGGIGVNQRRPIQVHAHAHVII